MTEREKLIALLTEAKYEGFKICGNHIDCNGCPAFKDGSRCTEGVTADHLIANGVTVQEWISVNDRLPENICPVLVVLEGMSTAFNGWYHDGKWWTVGAGTRPFKQKVTHWMPLPTPPKGENK